MASSGHRSRAAFAVTGSPWPASTSSGQSLAAAAASLGVGSARSRNELHGLAQGDDLRRGRDEGKPSPLKLNGFQVIIVLHLVRGIMKNSTSAASRQCCG